MLYAKIALKGQNITFIDCKNNEYESNRPLTKKDIKDLTWAYKQGRCASVKTDQTPIVFGTADFKKFKNSTFNLEFYPLFFKPVTASAEDKAQPITPMQNQTISFIHTDVIRNKPERLKMVDLKWKYLVRSVLKGKNIMVTGAAGCGKTQAVQSLAEIFNDRPYYYFNCGASQDPRSMFIGNTHFKKDEGTYFSESLFVKAIQEPNAVILLDELSRIHPEGMNILMPVLDQNQRYLRLDEADGAPTVKVADGVCFIGTANIGAEYTATRVLDRALLDRFVIIEMDLLDRKNESELLTMLYPGVAENKIKAIVEIACATRDEIKTSAPKISTIVSTRATIEIAGLIEDGFTLEEAAEVAIYPFYDNAGGIDSERTFIAQLVQKHAVVEKTDIFNTDDQSDDIDLGDIENIKPF